MPPLYKIVIDKKIQYAYDDAEKDRILAESGKDPEKVAHPALQGPGRDEPGAALGDHHGSRRRRNIMQIQMDDAVEAESVFTTLMGEQVEPRRQFIEENALRSPTWTCDMAELTGRDPYQIPIEEEVKTAYLNYAMSVIVSRALARRA